MALNAGLTIQVTNGNGIYHICINECGIGDNPNLNQLTVIKGNTTPFIHRGSIRYGFQTIVPKTSGSLILNIEGTIHAFPNALSLFDFPQSNIIRIKGIVHPTPPIHGKL